MIGFASLNIREEGYEIGYGFLSEKQGKGYAKESLTAILDHMKTLGVGRIYAGTAIKNLPSVGLLRCLGFELAGTEELSFCKDEEGKNIVFEGREFVKIL